MKFPVSSMTSKPIRIAAIGDIHLGHHKTQTHSILDNLRRAFPDNETTGELDLVLFEGDVFDRLLVFPSENTVEITYWIMEFLDICRRRKIRVRVLEGTPSHDWRQSLIFDTLNRAMGSHVDLKYVDTLSIEYIEALGLNVLYVPDEWAPEADDVWRQTKDLLNAHGLERVDIACMHGAFNYQIPMSHNTHIPERYLSIVKHYIFIGHVHKHQPLDRILPAGSFDRLCHGEEEPKGHVRAVIYPDGQREYEFVENPGAKIYKTLDMQDTPLVEALARLKDQVADCPEGSHYRLRLKRNDELFTAIATVRSLYPQFYWTTQLEEIEAVIEQLKVDSTVPQPITITRENLGGLVMDRLPNLTQVLEQKVRNILAEVC